ncbi:MAG: DUF3379 domain-containing protein [Burkholderiales bacterium]|nr:DUF3379 domain-containing protein [Burkholderiales bacterium]
MSRGSTAHPPAARTDREHTRLYERKRVEIDEHQELDDIEDAIGSSAYDSLEMRDALRSLPEGFVFHLNYRTADEEPQVVAAAALGSNHPAVAAINYVLDNEPKLLKENRTGDMAVLLAALEKMRMRLPADGTTVRYLGKCPVPNGEGDHVVLQTPFGRVSLILVPDQLFASSVVVADRSMLALAAPTRSRNGSLILVADSVKTAQALRDV